MSYFPFEKPEITPRKLRITLLISAPVMIILLTLASQINTKILDPWVVAKILFCALSIIFCGFLIIISIILLIFGPKTK